MRKVGWVTVVITAFVVGGKANTQAESSAEGWKKRSLTEFREDVYPLLRRFCIECHGDKTQEGDVRLDTLNPDMAAGSDGENWHDVINQLNLGEMPPAEAPQLTETQRDKILHWVNRELKRAVSIKRSTGGHVILRRLTRYEYANTMRDLLGVDLDFAADLPPESVSADGFRNNGATLGMSPLQLEYYLQAARMGLGKAIVTGEKPRVYTHHAKESVLPGKRQRKGNVSVGNRLGPGGQFLARLDEFPREGEFLIRVKAGARIPAGMAYPRLSVAVGLQADVQAPQKIAGEVDILESSAGPQVYEFRGRIEDFPIPGKNPKFPGIKITLTHVSNTPPSTPVQDMKVSKKLRKQNKKNKARKKRGQDILETPIEDPTKPLIAIESIEFEGPIFDAWPPSSHTDIFFTPKSLDDEVAYAREVLRRFMTRAFRRPVDSSEVEQMLTLYRTIRPGAASVEDAMRDVLAMVLISPDFLYLIEPREQSVANSQRKQPLTDHELAARLSYFLWSTMPDEQLAQLARRDKLRDRDTLEKQVRAMIADERSWNFVKHFTTQWLDLSGLDRVAVNPSFYPQFDDRLKSDMRLETQHFFAEILKNDLSALNFIDSEFAMLNQPLANHYGIEGPRGSTFARVSLKPENHRGGLLTQASILLANSTGEESHPIRRAVWLLDRLLDDPPSPPPPDVPELETDQPDVAALPLKKQLELHRTKSACMSCHRGIDPWGVPLENFDAVGLWRTEVSKPGAKKRQTVSTAVDATSTLPGGHDISGIDSLKRHLLTQEHERFSRAFVSRVMTYSLGRSLELSDIETIDRLTTEFAENGYRLSDLIVAIVQSDEFCQK